MEWLANLANASILVADRVEYLLLGTEAAGCITAYKETHRITIEAKRMLLIEVDRIVGPRHKRVKEFRRLQIIDHFGKHRVRR